MAQKQIRTVKAALEHRLGCKLDKEHPILPWLIRHASATINRYSVGKDGKTAHQRVRGRPFSAATTEFGECVWYRIVKGNKRGKLDARWGKGVWLGIREESNESLVGTPLGVIKIRTFRRRGSMEERWNLEEINGFRGVPWEPIPGREGIKIRSRVFVPETTDISGPAEVEARIPARRRFKITKADLDRHGTLLGCPGCQAYLEQRDRAVNHSEECRQRLAEALTREGDERPFEEAARVGADEEALASRKRARVEQPEVEVEISPTELAANDREERESPDDDMHIPDEVLEMDVTSLGRHVFQITARLDIAKDIDKWEKRTTGLYAARRWDTGVAQMEEAIRQDGINAHVTEIYSPPRVTAMAEKFRMIPGLALDLTTLDPEDGKPWDFNDPAKQVKAERLLRTQKSLLVIGSPMCAAFSQLQHINYARMTPGEVEQVKEEAGGDDDGPRGKGFPEGGDDHAPVENLFRDGGEQEGGPAISPRARFVDKIDSQGIRQEVVQARQADVQDEDGE